MAYVIKKIRSHLDGGQVKSAGINTKVILSNDKQGYNGDNE